MKRREEKGGLQGPIPVIVPTLTDGRRRMLTPPLPAPHTFKVFDVCRRLTTRGTMEKLKLFLEVAS